MNPSLCLSLCLAAMICRATAPQEAENRAPPAIVLSIFDYAGAPADALAKAEEEVTRIFRAAGIEVTCVDTQTGSRPLPFCRNPYEPSSFAVRILRRSEKQARGLPFLAAGYAIPGSRYANVIFEHIRREAKAAQVPEGVMLGHAIAHETGHLLLPPGYHSRCGIMRAQLGRREWTLALQGGLRFSDTEARIMREAIEAQREK